MSVAGSSFVPDAFTCQTQLEVMTSMMAASDFMTSTTLLLQLYYNFALLAVQMSKN